MTDRRDEALERLGQWERDAKMATKGPWRFNDTSDRRGHKGEFRAPSPMNGFMLVDAWCNDRDFDHIANFGPDVALRLIEGLRAVLESRDPDGDWCPFPRILTNAILGPGAEGTQEAPRESGDDCWPGHDR